MNNVLVTGGAGYIGSHTCKQLAQCGFNPVTIDNLSTGHTDAVRWGPLIVADLHDTETLVRVLERQKIHSVIHFAAHAYVGESVKEPLRYYQNNTSGSISLLKAMRLVGVNRLVFSSTCAVYGDPIHPSLAEDHPTKPVNPYGRSKRFVEEILVDESKAKALNFVALRYFNAAGASPDGDIGERHDPETHLIPLAIGSALGGAPLKIFGNNYETPDGTAIRDYVHVEDLACAHIQALHYLDGGGKSDFFNLGTGAGSSVMEIITALRCIGASPVYTFDERRPGDPARLIANADKARDFLNWYPTKSGIKNILTSALRWHSRRP